MNELRNIPWFPPDIRSEEKNATMKVTEFGWYTYGKETGKIEKELRDELRIINIPIRNDLNEDRIDYVLDTCKKVMG